MKFQNNNSTPIAWVSLFAALIAAASFIPLIPYVTGGGFLPLSIPVSAASTLILGFWPGILSAFIGGLIGMFINPSVYPFGVLDVFFVAVLPAITCGLAFRANMRGFWLSNIAFLIISGVLGEVVPYYYPGANGGFAENVPQPQYGLLVAVFFLPWLLIYVSPLSTKYLHEWLHKGNKTRQIVAVSLGGLMGLMPWSLWMIFPVALTLGLAVNVTIATWIFALWSRIILSILMAILFVPVIVLLKRSGLPAPSGALWNAE